MLKRAIKLFTDRRLWVRQILIAGLSGGVAWFLGDLLVDGGGVVAAIVSTLSIRISLHKSIREGFGQIVGTAIGASTALLAVSIFDFGFIAIAITIILCAVVARALHLGEVASVNVPVTALIVIGPGISQTAFETADICITISSQFLPSSSMRATAPSWPWARLMRFAIAITCSSSDRT